MPLKKREKETRGLPVRIKFMMQAEPLNSGGRNAVGGAECLLICGRLLANTDRKSVPKNRIKEKK